jgi:hypothetical protein
VVGWKAEAFGRGLLAFYLFALSVLISWQGFGFPISRSTDVPITPILLTHPAFFQLSLQTKTLPQIDPCVTLG